MKKLLLPLFFIFFINSVKALNIQNITISSNSENEINILLDTAHGSCMFYNSYNYSVTNNTIILNVCYNPQLCNAVTYLSNNIQIPLNNLSAGNYQLTVNIFFYNLQTSSCQNLISDTATLNFSTPLNDTVTLSNDNFNGKKDIFLYPNPSSGIINFNEEFSGESFSIYDHLGRKILKKQNAKNRLIDLKDLENGVYLVELLYKDKSLVKKIILKK